MTRFAVGTWMGTHHITDQFPWATFLINVSGCFFFGLVWSACEQGAISEDLRLVLLAGFAGAFTTFSTYIFDTVQLYGTARWQPLVLSFSGQLVLGILGMLLGLRVGRNF